MSDAQKMGGYKATLSNPNTSEEAKQRAQDILDGNTDAGDTSSKSDNSKSDNSKSANSKSDGEKNSGNVIGGHKANLHNPNTSDESKERSRQVLSEQGVDVEE